MKVIATGDRSRWRRLAYIPISVSVISFSLLMAPLASAASGTIGGKPAHPDPNNPRTQSIFVKTIKPGNSVQDAVEVVNSTGESKSVQVYATDSVRSSGGAFACAQAAEPATSTGKWISVEQTDIVVPPNESVTVPFTITAPQNAEPGEQNGCIVLQEKKDPTFQGGIGISFRTAIRAAILVPGTIRKELAPHGLGVKVDTKKVVISPSAQNTGNVSLDTTVHTSVRSLFGQTISADDNVFPVLRGEVSEWNIESTKPSWGGFYIASYTLAYDSSQHFIGSTTGTTAIKTINGSSRIFFAAPDVVPFIIELCILAVIGLIIFHFFKRRHITNAKKTWTNYTVHGAEQIQDIAEHHHISWKKLVKVNNLHAPYTLHSGQVIQVPHPRKASKKPLPSRKR